MISLCDACRYGQTDKCTRKDRNITKECYIPFSGESIAEKEIRADERKKVIDELANLIDNGDYCLQEECPYYQDCSFHSCPIDNKAEEIIKTWLMKLKEQK